MESHIAFVLLCFKTYLPSWRAAHLWKASDSVCLCLCNPWSCLNSLSSHQSQQVSMQPCTDSALFPTGRLSSRSWLAWLTRTHLARRPWRRGRHPVWISSGSCWPGLTPIWVRRAHPNTPRLRFVCFILLSFHNLALFCFTLLLFLLHLSAVQHF